MATEPYLGTLTAFGGNFTIENWAVCSGQVLAVEENAALFSLLGCMYGGDCRTSFGLPDLRGRSPVGMGQIPGSSHIYQQGLKQGHEEVVLAVSQLPPHTHKAVFTPDTEQAAGTFEVAKNTATVQIPTSQSYLAANTSAASYFEPTPFEPADLVKIPGLTVSGGGSGGTVTVGDTGSALPINIINPVLPLNWLIAIEGLYPPRS